MVIMGTMKLRTMITTRRKDVAVAETVAVAGEATVARVLALAMSTLF